MSISGGDRAHYIDICRGVAILMVITVHVGMNVRGAPEWLVDFTALGQFGVQLFFVASAFTLCQSAERRGITGNWIRGFFIRRFFRIAPLYYCGIVFYFLLAVSLHRPEPFTVPAIAANLTFTHGFFPFANNNIVPGGWSIGTEMAFYMLFPALLPWLLTKKSPRLAALLSAVSACALSLLISTSFDEIGNNSFFYYNIVNQLPVFLIGMAAFFARDVFRTRHILLAGIASTVAITYLFFSRWEYAFIVLPIFCGIVFSALLLTLRDAGAHSRVLEVIGKRSYSIYIVHFVFAFQATSLAQRVIATFAEVSPFVIFALAWCSTVAISSVIAGWTGRRIEERFIEIGNTLARRSIAQT